MTLAPAFMQCSTVGMDAVMRASEVTLPSLTGTLRSARISTRLPARSRSVSLIKDMRTPIIYIAKARVAKTCKHFTAQTLSDTLQSMQAEHTVCASGSPASTRGEQIRLVGDVLHHTQHIAGIAVLVVVPGHHLDEGAVQRDTGTGIKDRGVVRPRKSVETTLSSV